MGVRVSSDVSNKHLCKCKDVWGGFLIITIITKNLAKSQSWPTANTSCHKKCYSCIQLLFVLRQLAFRRQVEISTLSCKEAWSNSLFHQPEVIVQLRRGRVKDCFILSRYKNRSTGKQRLMSKNR